MVLDAMVIMPNHLHGVIVLTEDDEAAKPRQGLPEIVRAFKSYSARRINALRRTPGLPVWQRSYYEHILRDEEDWERIRGYIYINPQEWDRDLENPLVGRGES
ncbi:MAG: transposase [Anaerolineales bacterium]